MLFALLVVFSSGMSPYTPSAVMVGSFNRFDQCEQQGRAIQRQAAGITMSSGGAFFRCVPVNR
jgi:hypothetical protein